VEKRTIKAVLAAAVVAGVLVGACTAQAQFAVLHNFAGGSGSITGGANPYGDVTVSGSNVYGMTTLGPPGGAIFRMNTNGTSYTLIYQFLAVDGALPFGKVTLSGSNLYGMVYRGGTSDDGMIFRVGTDGNNFQILHPFTGGTNDGAHPFGSLTLSGDTLYGMTYQGAPRISVSFSKSIPMEITSASCIHFWAAPVTALCRLAMCSWRVRLSTG